MKIDKLENLLKKFEKNVIFNADLKKKNWFNIGGKAKVFFKANELKDLIEFLKVLDNKEKKTGCTVHYVNNRLDDGSIIVQKSFYLNAKENELTLKKKTQLLEYKAYPEAIIKIFRYT